MNTLLIRNMFLLVTALAVMFLLACGETVAEDSADELAMYTFANCDELAQVFVAGTPGLTRLVVGSVRTNLNNNDVMRCSAKGVFTFTTTTWSYTPTPTIEYRDPILDYLFGTSETSETSERKWSSSTVDKTIYMEYQKVPIKRFDFWTYAEDQYLNENYFPVSKPKPKPTATATPAPSQPPLPNEREYVARGISNTNSKQYAKAIDDFTIAIGIHSVGVSPNHAKWFKNLYSDAYFNRGISYYHLSRINFSLVQLEKALEDWGKVLEINPNHPEVICWIRQLLEEHPELTDAEYLKENYFPVSKLRVMDVLFTPTPCQPPLKTYKQYFDRGVSNNNSKQYIKAIEDFTKAIELNPYRADTYFNRGLVYQGLEQYALGLEQYTNAIEDFTKAIELYPDRADAYFNRGLVYQDLEQYIKAINDYTKAIRLNPYDTATYNNRGYSYYNLGQYEEALKNYAKAIKLDPTNQTALNNRKILLEEHPELKP